MQRDQKDKMSKEEIIKYVDELIKVNKRYDKRLAPLLYDFFLRANEKFEWSREEFLEKYQNYRNNVKIIKIRKIKDNYIGIFKILDKAIYIEKAMLKDMLKKPEKDSINYFVYNFFHECSHATDLTRGNEGIIRDGFYEIMHNFFWRDKKDTMLNEYANVLYTSLISGDEPMYYDRLSIYTRNNGSYGVLNLPGSIMCSAIGITEIELAKLKDKGREKLDECLKNKLLSPEFIINACEGSLNTIYNADQNNDKKNVALGLGNMADIAVIAIDERIRKSFLDNEKTEECIEKIYYDVYKIQKLLEVIDSCYTLDDEVYNVERFDNIEEILDRVRLYKRFLDNKDLFTNAEKGQIYNSIIHYNKDKRDTDLGKELIESKIKEEYSKDEFDIEEIVKKYHLQSNEPLNDNTALIEQVKKSFIKPTIKEKFKKVIGIEQEEFPMLPSVTEVLKPTVQSNMRNDIRYETPIIHDRSAEQQDTLRDKEESTRNENEDIR